MRKFALALVVVCATILPARTTKKTPEPDYTAFRHKLSKDNQILHALDRLTFGPRKGDVESVRKMGLKKWIELQLHPERIPENPELAKKLEPLESLRMTAADSAQRFRMRRGASVASDLAQGKLYRAILSPRQLEEELADFWYNHFNVFLDKGADRFLVPTYEREAIRPRVLGHFRDLLGATASSPAMLFYLDNWQSVARETQRASK